MSRTFSTPAIRRGTALIVDIAGTVALRSRIGDGAAGRCIRHALDTIIATARKHGGEFIKSYGDDVLAIFEHDAVNAAAKVAILAQHAAASAGLQLYAGFYSGEVEFRETMGHPDALGLTVNIAARLHKLTEGAPGRIFLAEESINALAPSLRARAARYGARQLKGIGTISIWTLDWCSAATTLHTVFAQELDSTKPEALLLRHGDSEVRLSAANGSCFVGRGRDCALRIVDPEVRISSSHLLLEQVGGRWLAQDISRNGTWLCDARTGEKFLLPHCVKAMLPDSGSLCLGRSFADDGEGRFTLSFFQMRGLAGGLRLS